MVSVSDIDRLCIPDADFTELLLFDGDLEGFRKEDVRRLASSSGSSLRFVHAQEMISHDRRRWLLDLASEDEGFRRECVEVVGKTRELADALGGLPAVIHPGGIRSGRADRRVLLGNLRDSLKELGPDKLLLENMPWFYWHEKEERMVANICVSIKDMERFIGLVEGFTLDVCHGYLSKPEGDPGYVSRFLAALGGRTRHVHVSDARAPDSEGLQIGDGSVDFSVLRGLRVPVLAEIWNGHENGGLGFKTAIERLRSLEKS